MYSLYVQGAGLWGEEAVGPALRFAKATDTLLALGYPPTRLELGALDLPPWAQGPLR